MTDDELNAAWLAGHSVLVIARTFKISEGTVAGKIRRLREREGRERWPNREFGRHRIQPPTAKPRAGKTTLPPLPSLE